VHQRIGSGVKVLLQGLRNREILRTMKSSLPDRGTPQLVMARMHLQDLPEVQLEAGYSLRHFVHGDEAGWNVLIAKTFKSNYDFDGTLLADPFYHPERVLFVEHSGEIVATACAWRSDKWGKNTGVLHMVGASPEHRGHQLGYQISLAALHQLVREGIHHVILQTDDDRLPAIATYIKLGFAPYLIDPNKGERWKKIYQFLGQI
jgi:mycothiol synthase